MHVRLDSPSYVHNPYYAASAVKVVRKEAHRAAHRGGKSTDWREVELQGFGIGRCLLPRAASVRHSSVYTTPLFFCPMISFAVQGPPEESAICKMPELKDGRGS